VSPGRRLYGFSGSTSDAADTGEDAWASEKTERLEFGVKGRSCEAKLLGDVGLVL
jgi:hypothetical protein